MKNQKSFTIVWIHLNNQVKYRSFKLHRIWIKPQQTSKKKKFNCGCVCGPMHCREQSCRNHGNKMIIQEKQLSLREPEQSTASSERIISTLSTNDLIPSLNFEKDD